MQMDYRGKSPVAFSFMGKREKVSSFKDILVFLCARLASMDPDCFEKKVLELGLSTSHGRKRKYFALSSCAMDQPVLIPGTRVYVETKHSANGMRIRDDVLELFGYSATSLSMEFAKVIPVAL